MKIERHIRQLDGVLDVSANLMRRTVTVTHIQYITKRCLCGPRMARVSHSP